MNFDSFWAKTDPFQSITTHGLISGRIAQHLLSDYLSPGVCHNLCKALHIEQQPLKSLVGYLVSLHDIGKIEFSFQSKDPDVRKQLESMPELRGFRVDPSVRHEKTGRDAVRTLWADACEEEDAIDLFSPIIGAHHQGKHGGTGFHKRSNWFSMQKEFEALMQQAFTEKASNRLPECEEDDIGWVGALLLGIMILSDWIASGDTFSDAESWIHLPGSEEMISGRIKDFLARSDLQPNRIDWASNFCGVWPNIPPDGRRALQQETERLFSRNKSPIRLLLLEAPMGEGKTEAGIYAALQMARQWGKDGLYLALPTAATANQMVLRVRKLLQMHNEAKTVRLLHAMAWLEDFEDFQCGSPDEADSLSAWLAPSKRSMLGQYAVGTVDQAMFAATVVKYGALRLLGLANKVLLIDEIHSYDAYMSEILVRLLEWCKAMEVPVVMLSATLPPEIKQKLLTPYTTQALSQAYPLLTAVTEKDETIECRVDSTTHHLRADLLFSNSLNNPELIAALAVKEVSSGGCICVLMNTVRDAQAVYLAIKERFSGEIKLFHAQFPAGRRAEIESDCLRSYGKDKSHRPKQSILVATQVVEQSLDVDFDAMITAIAPIDLLLQRLGRVFRHDNTPRPESIQNAKLTVLIPQEGESFGRSEYVYPKCVLQSCIRVLKDKQQIYIPDDIAELVRKGYDAAEVPESEIEQWLENQTMEQVEAGASHQYLANPPDRMYNALEDAVLYEDDAPVLAVKTRLSEPSVRIALLEQQQINRLNPYLTEKDGLTLAQVWKKDLAEEIMRCSVSVRMSRLGSGIPLKDYIQGGKLLSGVRIFPAENGVCLLGNGKTVQFDPELGLLIKDGES